MCKYCKGNETLKYDKNSGMSISINEGILKATNYEHTEDVRIKINFCPMCGRKFE